MEPSTVDPCIWYRENIILIIYVDDCLMFSRKKYLTDEFIKQLEADFTLKKEGDVNTYIGAQAQLNKKNNTIELKQPFFIQRIIEALTCNDHMMGKETPVLSNNMLYKDQDGPNRKQSWNYRLVIGMLNYLNASTRPDISYAVHQCAPFYTCPKLRHEQAMTRIIRYLIKIKNKGIEVTSHKERVVNALMNLELNKEEISTLSIIPKDGIIATNKSSKKRSTDGQPKIPEEISLSTYQQKSWIRKFTLLRHHNRR